MGLRPIVFAVLAAVGMPSPARADPPTQPKKPVNTWEFIGKYPIGEGAGLEYLNAVIKKDAIHRHGSIVDVYVGRDFTQIEGLWVPSDPASSAIASYQIDCKYHTYYERWYEWLGGTDAQVRQTMPYEWDAIAPDTDVALAEKHVCSSSSDGGRS